MPKPNVSGLLTHTIVMVVAGECPRMEKTNRVADESKQCELNRMPHVSGYCAQLVPSSKVGQRGADSLSGLALRNKVSLHVAALLQVVPHRSALLWLAQGHSLGSCCRVRRRGRAVLRTHAAAISHKVPVPVSPSLFPSLPPTPPPPSYLLFAATEQLTLVPCQGRRRGGGGV